MRFSMGLVSKARRLFVASPSKEKGLNGKNPGGELDFKRKQVDSVFSLRSPGFGSKEETFFDSRAWFDSDCEDDFFSVNGDFTPSRGSTPSHQFSTQMTSALNKAFSAETFSDTNSEPSPTGRKMKLADLLQETLQGERIGNEHNATNGNEPINGKPGDYKLNADKPPKSLEETPYLSGANSVCSSEPSPSRDTKRKKEKAWKSAHCCLPSLAQSLSFNDRRRQRMSPGRCSN